MNKSIRKWEIAGTIFIVIAGSALHFVFDMSGGWQPLAVIAAVNESVWEHLKLGFWPALLYFFLEYYFIRKSPNLLFAKATGILMIPVTIIILFYTYTAFIEDMLALDITIFVLAVVIGQFVSYRILTMKALPSWLNKSGVVLLVLIVMAFSTLTYFAPETAIFRDPVSGGYGIQ